MRRIVICAMLGVMLITKSAIYAQDDDAVIPGVLAAVFETRQTTPLIGEPIEIRLVVNVPSGVQIVEWPEVEPSWGVFQVTDVSEIDIETGEHGNKIHTQRIMARLWRPGDYETPETFIAYQRPGDNEILRIQVRSRFFSVASVLDGSDLELRSSRGPIGYFILPVWAVSLGLVLCVVGGYGLRWLWLARGGREIPPETITLSPAQMADEKLIRIRIDKTMSNEAKISAVEDVLRAFIHEQTAIVTDDLTTDALKQTIITQLNVDAEQHTAISHVLDQAELVKFARERIEDNRVEAIIETLRRWIAVVGLKSNQGAVAAAEVM